jgi:PAS domain S-box-containing protein
MRKISQNKSPHDPKNSPERKAQQRIAPIFVAAGLLLCASMAFTYRIGLIAIHANQRMAQELSVLLTLSDFSSALRDTELNQRNYLFTKDGVHLERYKRNLSQVQSQMLRLREISAAGNLPKERVTRAIDLAQQRLNQLDQSLEEHRARGVNAALAVANNNLRGDIMEHVRTEVAQMEAVKKNGIEHYSQRSAWATMVRNATFLGAGLLNLLFLVWVFRKISREMNLRNAAVLENSRQKELLATTLKSIGDGVITTDDHGNITFVNPVAEGLIGAEQREVSGEPLGNVFKIINEVTREPAENPAERALREGRAVGLANHTILISRDGQEVPIDDSAAPIREADGNMLGVVLVFRDVRKQRAAELTARNLAAIVEHSDDAIYSVDLNGIVTSWNRAAEKMFGYVSSEIVGQPVFILIPFDKPNEELQILDRVRHGERVEHYETIRRRKDGSDLKVSLTVSALKEPSSDRIIGVSKIARDITERKRMEQIARETGERYRTLFNSIDEGFCIIELILDADNRSQDYRFIEVNPAFEKQTGIKNAAGRRMREIAPQHEQYWFDIYGKVALTGEPIRFEERAEALDRWFDVYGYRVEQPESRRVAILFNDITERKKAEQALAKANKELEDYSHNLEAMVAERTSKLQQTVADLEAFSFTISHDLRSPLRAMQGFAQALEEEYSDKLDADGREYLKRIGRAAVRLDDLIREVLTFSRAGRADLPIETVNLDQLVEEVIQTYPSIRMPHAEITVKHPLAPVLANRASLVQCVSNLLTNAVKFVPAGATARIQVATEQHDSKVKFAVKDNGIGIPENLLSKIFEPFQRGHPEAGYEGTGMGLAVVRKAIQRMGGTLGVQSHVGQGSTFWLELPAAN